MGNEKKSINYDLKQVKRVIVLLTLAYRFNIILPDIAGVPPAIMVVENFSSEFTCYRHHLLKRPQGAKLHLRVNKENIVSFKFMMS